MCLNENGNQQKKEERARKEQKSYNDGYNYNKRNRHNYYDDYNEGDIKYHQNNKRRNNNENKKTKIVLITGERKPIVVKTADNQTKVIFSEQKEIKIQKK